MSKSSKKDGYMLRHHLILGQIPSVSDGNQPPAFILNRPVQQDLLPIDCRTLELELKKALLSDSTHLPEIQLRYLILLILSNSDFEQIFSAASFIRSEINAQRYESVI